MTRKVYFLAASRVNFFFKSYFCFVYSVEGAGGIVGTNASVSCLGVLFFPKDLNLKMVKQMVLIKR